MFKAAFISFLTSFKGNMMEQTLAGSLITLLVYIYGLVATPLFWVLMFFMTVDFVLGFIAAIINREFSLKKLEEGVLKKFFVVILILIGAVLDYTLNIFGIETAGLFYKFVMAVLIGRELGSSAENADKCGFWVPKIIKSASDKLKQFGGEK